MELYGAGRENLDVLQDQVANMPIRNRRAHGVASCIMADTSDRDDAGEAARHLIECKSMNMRMKPVQAGRMIFWDFDPVFDRVHHVGSMLMRLRRTNPVVGVKHRYKNIVSKARVRGRRRSRRNKKAVGVQIGWVQV